VLAVHLVVAEVKDAELLEVVVVALHNDRAAICTRASQPARVGGVGDESWGDADCLAIAAEQRRLRSTAADTQLAPSHSHTCSLPQPKKA
jgi:hypothetical protein